VSRFGYEAIFDDWGLWAGLRAVPSVLHGGDFAVSGMRWGRLRQQASFVLVYHLPRHVVLKGLVPLEKAGLPAGRPGRLARLGLSACIADRLSCTMAAVASGFHVC
jgi:hypothetical protein